MTVDSGKLSSAAGGGTTSAGGFSTDFFLDSEHETRLVIITAARKIFQLFFLRPVFIELVCARFKLNEGSSIYNLQSTFYNKKGTPKSPIYIN